MAYLLRTFTQAPDEGEKPASVGSVVLAPPGASYDTDEKFTLGQQGEKLRHNAADYMSHAAVGYVDPMFSLAPLIVDGKPAIDKLSKAYDIADVYEALPSLLKKGNFEKAVEFAKKLAASKAEEVYGTSDYGELSDMGFYPDLMVELDKSIPLHEKNKYATLLQNLRRYGELRPGEKDYDRPQHALIEAPLGAIETAKDKLVDFPAEQDNMNEYRVHGYKVRGLWTPRHVDEQIKKHFPNYEPGDINSLADNERAKGALSDILQMDPDGIVSDANCKDIVRSFNDMIGRYYDGKRRSNSIAKAIVQKYGI